MAFLAATLLIFIREEETCFWCLVQLMSTFNMRELFTCGMAGLQVRIYQFSHLLRDVDPDLFHHFAHQMVDPETYLPRWALSLFTATPMNQDLVFRIWDLFFLHGWSFFFQVALQIVHQGRKFLLSSTSDTILKPLTDVAPLLERIEPLEFLQRSMNIPVSDQVLQNLRQSYLRQHDRQHAPDAQFSPMLPPLPSSPSGTQN